MVLTADNTSIPAGFVAFLVIFFIVGIGSLVMFVVALVDMVKRPDWEWKLAGQEKILWILLVVLVNFLAIPALIYWFNIRTKLIAVREAAQRGDYGPGRMTYAGWEPSLGPIAYAGAAPAGCIPTLPHPACSGGGTGPAGPGTHGVRSHRPRRPRPPRDVSAVTASA